MSIGGNLAFTRKDEMGSNESGTSRDMDVSWYSWIA